MAPSASESLRPTLFIPERGHIEGQEDPLVRGVVLDVHVTDGLDTLAGYADGTARYLNHSGKAIIWDAPHSQIQSLIETLIALAAPLLRSSEAVPYGQFPAAPSQDPPQATFFGPDSLHVVQLGEGEASGRLLGAGAMLMQALIAAASRQR